MFVVSPCFKFLQDLKMQFFYGIKVHKINFGLNKAASTSFIITNQYRSNYIIISYMFLNKSLKVLPIYCISISLGSCSEEKIIICLKVDCFS